MSEKTPLASVQQIIDIKPIEGADKIELAFVKSWQVVIAKKDNFKVGDLVVYVEINAQMPEKPEYEFLRERKFRVRTIRLRKQLSQGLILPLASVSITTNGKIEFGDLTLGDDVTDVMGITKYDPEAQEEKALSVPKHQNKVMRFLMGFAPFRKVYLKLNQKDSGNFPTHVISKSDEENLQNCAEIIMNNFERSFYITEKLEGQSATFYTSFEKRWGFKRKVFGVCSRNLRLTKPDNSKYWASAKKYNLENNLKDHDAVVAIQAEQTGEGIQGNIYKLNGVELFVFTVKIDGKRLGLFDTKEFCRINRLKMVPVIQETFVPCANIACNDRATIVKYLIDYSNGKSLLFDTMREGIVMRMNDNPEISFKVKSPDYLIKHEA